MRIGLLTQWFDPEPGPAALPGVLARHLAERGHDVKVLTGFPNYPSGELYPGYSMGLSHEEQVRGVRVRRVPLVPSHSASIMGRVANYSSFALAASAVAGRFLEDRDALWVSNSPASVALPMVVSSLRFNLPVLLHVLDLWPDTVASSRFLGDGRTSRTVTRLLKRPVQGTYRRADRIAVISPGVVDVLERRGVPREKLTFVPLWADEARYRPTDGTTLRQQLNVAPDTVVVMYAGTLGPTQDLTTLLKAMALLPSDGPALECWIAGSGVQERSLRGRAESLGLARNRVRFLGRIEESRMPEYLGACDASFVGLRDDPGLDVTFPSKVSVALAAGKALVVAARGDTAEIAERSAAALVACPDDPESVMRALDHAAHLGRARLDLMGQRGRAFYMSHLSEASGVATIEHLLQRITHHRSRVTT